MAKMQIVFSALIIIQVAFAAPLNSTDSLPSTDNPNNNETTTLSAFNNIIEQVKTAYDDVILTLNKQFPNTKEVSDKFIEQSRKFIKDVEELFDKVEDQMDKNQEQFTSVVDKISEQLSTHLDKLKELVGPNAVARVDQIKDALEKSFKMVYDSIKSVVDAGRPSQMYNNADRMFGASMTFMDRFLNIAQVMQNSFESTFKEARRAMMRSGAF